mmetsp:Transcript_3898/g.10706  ORF Transcript_3898/g.10706 Transcript_3898/m.10706 type:complete len:212 (-) Transcript_3898:2149-2784(-)
MNAAAALRCKSSLKASISSPSCWHLSFFSLNSWTSSTFFSRSAFNSCPSLAISSMRLARATPDSLISDSAAESCDIAISRLSFAFEHSEVCLSSSRFSSSAFPFASVTAAFFSSSACRARSCPSSAEVRAAEASSSASSRAWLAEATRAFAAARDVCAFFLYADNALSPTALRCLTVFCMPWISDRSSFTVAFNLIISSSFSVWLRSCCDN